MIKALCHLSHHRRLLSFLDARTHITSRGDSMTQGKQLSRKMTEIIRAAQVVKSHAYDSPMNEIAELQMQSLGIWARDGRGCRDALQSPGVEELVRSLDL